MAVVIIYYSNIGKSFCKKDELLVLLLQSGCY